MTTFTLLGGKLILHESDPRPTEDPLWLATTIPALPRGAQVLDAGCGSGVAGLALLLRQPGLHLTALDIDASLTTLAARNATLNNLRLTPHPADILAHPKIGPFDAILCNPPYHAQEHGHTTANPQKSLAHSLPAGHFPLWLAALVKLLKPTGSLYLIAHATYQADLLTFAPANGYSLTLTSLQTSASRPPKRLLAHLEPSLLPQTYHNPPLAAYNPTLRLHHLGS